MTKPGAGKNIHRHSHTHEGINIYNYMNAITPVRHIVGSIELNTSNASQTYTQEYDASGNPLSDAQEYLYTFRNLLDFKSDGTDTTDITHYNPIKFSDSNTPYRTGPFSLAVAARVKGSNDPVLLDLSSNSLTCKVVLHSKTDENYVEGTDRVTLSPQHEWNGAGYTDPDYHIISESFDTYTMGFNTRPQIVENYAQATKNHLGLVFTFFPARSGNPSLLDCFNGKLNDPTTTPIVLDLYLMVFDINNKHFDFAKGTPWQQ